MRTKFIYNTDADCGCGATGLPIPTNAPVQPNIDLCATPSYPTEADSACPITVKSKCVPCGITNVDMGITPDMNLAQVLALMMLYAAGQNQVIYNGPTFQYVSDGHVEEIYALFILKAIATPTDAGSIALPTGYAPMIKYLDNILNTTLSLTFPYKLIANTTFENPTIQNISFPLLEEVIKESAYQNAFDFTCNALISLSLPKLKKVWGFNLSVPNLTTIDLPELVTVINYIDIYAVLVTTINIPKLVSAPQVSMSNNSILESFILPSLEINNQFSLGACTALIELQLPKLIKSYQFSVSYCDLLTTLIMPDTFMYGSNFTISGCPILTTVKIGTVGVLKDILMVFLPNNALSSQSITDILDVLISLDGTNGTTLWGTWNGSNPRELHIDGGTNAVPDAGQLAKIAILTGRGAIVTHN